MTRRQRQRLAYLVEAALPATTGLVVGQLSRGYVLDAALFATILAGGVAAGVASVAAANALRRPRPPTLPRARVVR